MDNASEILMQVQDSSTDGFTLFKAVRDDAHRIIDFERTYINKAGAKILNTTPDKLISIRMLTEHPQLEQLGVFDEYKKVVETGKPFFQEFSSEIDSVTRWFRVMTLRVGDGIGASFIDTTHQHELESKLRENESYLRSITESIPQLVWINGPDGLPEFYNHRWYEYTNMPTSSFNSREWSTILHPDDVKEAQKKWARSLKTGEPYEVEYRIKSGKTNEYRWFLGRALPIRDEQGEIIKWFGTCTDIHAQRLAADSQRFLAEASKILSSSNDYKKALQKVAQLAVPHISDWVTVEMYDGVNEEMVAVAHVDPKKVKWAKKLRKERPTDMNDNTGLPYVLKTGKYVLYPLITDEMIQAAVKSQDELELIREIGFTSVMIVPLFVNDKTVGAVQFVSTDSKRQFSDSDLQMAQELAGRISLTIQNAAYFEEIRLRENQLQVLYDSNLIGVVYSDGDGNVLSANDAFFTIIGYTRKEFEKQSIKWDNLIPPEYKNIESTKLNELFETGTATPFEKEYIRKDGSQVPVIVGKTLIDRKKRTSISFILDITERKKLESRKDEFLGIASHELKTPLTSIKGYVQILERIIQEMGDDKATALVSKTNTYIDKLNSLIVDLLDVSKIQAGKLQFHLENFDLSQLIIESVQAIQPTTLHKLIIKSVIKATVSGDRQRLDQVMANLMTNAIKYSPADKEVLVSMTKDADFVYVHIQDFGIGIEEQYQKLLFQRFYRVEASSRQFSGLGIGLYITSEIVSRHGGRVWLESTPGIGSTFHFSLPLQESKSS